MILMDTGPLVALFDKQDSFHKKAVDFLRSLKEPILTTIPILTEAFYLLTPGSQGAVALRDFVAQEGLLLEFFTFRTVLRAFELMERYADHPMDLADASLIVAAETHHLRKVCTIDRNDFETYRIKKGFRYYPLSIVDLH